MKPEDKAVVQQALEALENTSPLGFNMEADKKFFKAITALRQLLEAEPVQSAERWEPGYVWSPVEDYEKEWGSHVGEGFKMVWFMPLTTNGFLNKLAGDRYTTPPAQPVAWAGLTDEEIKHGYRTEKFCQFCYDEDFERIVRWTTSKLREKNGGAA